MTATCPFCRPDEGDVELFHVTASSSHFNDGHSFACPCCGFSITAPEREAATWVLEKAWFVGPAPEHLQREVAI